MREKFRHRPLDTFLVLSLLTQLGYLAAWVPFAALMYLTQPGPGPIWWGLAAGCAALAVYAAVFTPLIVWGWPVYVSPDSLKTYNFWGLYRSPAWDDITTVKPLRLGIGTFLLVSARGLRGPLWLPLFLTDTERFADRVREYAGPDHPLSEALDRYAASDE